MKAKKWLEKMDDCDHDHIRDQFKETAKGWLRAMREMRKLE